MRPTDWAALPKDPGNAATERPEGQHDGGHAHLVACLTETASGQSQKTDALQGEEEESESGKTWERTYWKSASERLHRSEIQGSSLPAGPSRCVAQQSEGDDCGTHGADTDSQRHRHRRRRLMEATRAPRRTRTSTAPMKYASVRSVARMTAATATYPPPAAAPRTMYHLPKKPPVGGIPIIDRADDDQPAVIQGARRRSVRQVVHGREPHNGTPRCRPRMNSVACITASLIK